MITIYWFVGLVVWLYGLSICKRAALPTYYFIWGSVGLFFLLFFLSRPYLIWLMVQTVVTGVGLIVGPLHLAQTAAGYGLILIDTANGALSLAIDYECSGVIETIAFWSLLIFYPIYRLKATVFLGLVGLFFIYFANVARLVLIVILVHYFGSPIFFFAHTILGRLFFYALVVYFYYRVFTYGYFKATAKGVA